jgi:hypothetical protein
MIGNFNYRFQRRVRRGEPTSGEKLYPIGAAARFALLYRRNIKPAGFRRLGARLCGTLVSLIAKEPAADTTVVTNKSFRPKFNPEPMI